MTVFEQCKAAAYIICATPRSGSTLLCDLLHETGVCGSPHSFFRDQDYEECAEHFGVSVEGWPDRDSFDRAYLDAVVDYGTGATPLFGMRLMWESLAPLAQRLETFYPGLPSDSARFDAAFGPVLYIHLSRQDKVAQAVSRLKAEQTGLWHVDADGTERERVKPGEAPTYDAQALSELVAALAEHDAAWERWFARQGVVPLRISYETLSAQPQATVALLLDALGQDRSIAATVEPRTARLADAESRDWAARLRQGLRQG